MLNFQFGKEKSITGKKLDLSVVIPVYNEEENLKLLSDTVIGVLNKLNKSYELILVDDGSKDNSPMIFKEITEKNKNIKVII